MFDVVVEGTCAVTKGLARQTGFEITLDVSRGRRAELVDDASRLALYLGRYFEESGARLVTGETVEWASSLLVARMDQPGVFAFDERSFDGKTVLPGVACCTQIWTDQSQICRQFRSDYRPAAYGSLLAASPGLLSGAGTVEGVRYATEPPMSGWWLFAEGYDGGSDEFKSMKVEHVFHVLKARPDLAKFLALSTGFAFKTPSDDDGGLARVWFENDVAAQGK